jgi:hypothetical protein
MNKEEESRLERFKQKVIEKRKPIVIGLVAAFSIAAGAYVVIKRSHDKKEALKKIAEDVAKSGDPAAALITGAQEFAREVGPDMADVTSGLAKIEPDEATQDIYNAITALAKPTPQSNRPTS